MVSILSTLGLALLSGGIKCLTEDSLSKAAFMTLDGLFSGPLGNLGQQGFDRIKQQFKGPDFLDKNEDIERCSRDALLNALIAFSEAAKKHTNIEGYSPKEREDCLHFLDKAQQHFKKQIDELAKLPPNDPKLFNKSLLNGDLITQILASGQKERIEGLKSSFTKLALDEYTYPPQNILYKPLSHWLFEGLPDGTHWFVYYIQTFHANLKKDVPAYCKNARRILTQKQLADLNLLTKENLAKLDELMPLGKEILEVAKSIKADTEQLKTDNKELKAGISDLKADTKEIKEHLTKPKFNLNEQLTAGSEQYYKVLTGANGPYHHLDISEAILAGMIPDDPVSKPSTRTLSATLKNSEGQEFTLGASLSAQWGQQKPHILLLGDGGMGKTVSLIHLWQTLLENKQRDARQPIPLFITLHEFNTVSESERYDFITNRIAWHYLDRKKDQGEATNAIWDFMKDKTDQDQPHIVLLLDGFNEITLDASLRSPLLLELQEINQKSNAVQIVLSSRHEMNFNWASGFQTMALQPLDSVKVEAYLHSHGVAFPSDVRLKPVLQNPMMLTLYANSSEIVERYKVNPQFEFKPLTTTQGELLWNFLEAQVVKLSNQLGFESQDFHFNKFIIRHFLPYIGYEMEKEGQFEVDEKGLEQIVVDACKYYYKKEFIQAYPEYRAYLRGFNLQDLDFMEEGERFERISKLICRKLNLMKQKQESYEFIHQNFRDFFAAVHILNELHRDVQNKTLPQILKHRTLSLYIRRLMGQIEGEAYQCEEPIPSPTKLMRVLDAFRGVFESGSVGYSIWNIVNVWKDTRLHLGGADFSHLNLLKTGFQEVSCYKRKGGKYQSACFDNSLVGEKVFLPQGHSGYVNSVAFHLDGRSFISGSNDDTVKAWDLATGECLATFRGHAGYVYSVAFHPDGRSFISGSSDDTVKAWDLATGECLATFRGHSNSVNSVAFHPDGRSFISGSSDDTVKAWDWATGECLATFRGHSGSVFSVAFHPDGCSFISGSSDDTVKAWDLATGECLATFRGHSDSVFSVAFHPDGRSFISGSSDDTVKAWDWATGECLATFQGHSDSVKSVAFHPDGCSFISGSSDDTVKAWDLATGECLATFQGHAKSVNSVAFHPDCRSFISGSWDKTVKAWDLATGECLATFRGHSYDVFSVAFHPDGRSFISGSSDDTVKAWDLATGECLATFQGHSDSVNSVAFHPDGRSFISGSWDKTVKAWDWATGECLATFQGHSDSVNSVAFHPDGRSFISGSFDHTIKAWDWATGECLATFRGHSYDVFSVAFHPDGRSFISGSFDKAVKAWDWATGECLDTFQGHAKSVNSVAFHPDGCSFISGSSDDTVKAWDLATGECLDTFQGHSGYVDSVAFHPDGRSFISGSFDDTIKAWDWATGESLATFQGHSGSVDSVAFHPDGRSFISGSWDKTVKAWDLATGECLMTLMNQPGMHLFGCSFMSLHPQCNISEKTKKLMQQYGVLFDEKDKEQWQEAVQRMFGED